MWLPATCRAGAAPGGVDVLALGEVERLGETLGDALREALGEVDGLRVGEAVTLPVQVTPLRVNDVGTGLLPVNEPMKPGETVALVPSAPFQVSLAIVTVAPDWLHLPPQPWATSWVAVGKVKPTVQVVAGSPRLVTSRPPWKPPGHWFCTVYFTVQPVAALAGADISTMPPAATARPVAASNAMRRLMGSSLDI